MVCATSMTRASLTSQRCQRCSPFDTILQEHARADPKDLGYFKADAVLALIGEVLGLIPFKTDPAHYNSIITNSQLHNQKPLWHNRAGREFGSEVY
jgi:hypothetical protein